MDFGVHMSQAKKMTYREAVRAALREAIANDSRVFLMGEDVGRYGGAYACSKGLLEEFGEERVRDTPLSESTFVGAGIGAALNGMRPNECGRPSPRHWPDRSVRSRITTCARRLT
jgi:pyruvate dehydrogenase E1 component beta subunit